MHLSTYFILGYLIVNSLCAENLEKEPPKLIPTGIYLDHEQEGPVVKEPSSDIPHEKEIPVVKEPSSGVPSKYPPIRTFTVKAQVPNKPNTANEPGSNIPSEKENSVAKEPSSEIPSEKESPIIAKATSSGVPSKYPPIRTFTETAQVPNKPKTANESGSNIPSEKGRYYVKNWVTIEAALTIEGRGNDSYLFLYAGDMFQMLKNGKPYRIGPQEGNSIPSSLHLQAAFTLEDGSSTSKIYYGDKYGLAIGSRDELGHAATRKLKYGLIRAFLRNGGPDAAGRRSGQVYVFKGCQMVIRKAWNKWGKPKDMKAVGLPCPIDAAWKEDDDMIVLKGDQFWRWAGGRNGAVSGPFAFDETYPLVGNWALKPAPQEEE